MKEPYRWDYHIKIKTKEGTYEYEKENVLEAVKLAEQHPDYEEFYMERKQLKSDKYNEPLEQKTLTKVKKLNKVPHNDK